MGKYLITGGCGFIGCNLAARLLKEGKQVILFDNLSRWGANSNLYWLKTQGDFQFVRGDIRDYNATLMLFKEHPDIRVVYHQASQVAVTKSVQNPMEDFEINALGTFNLLEACRTAGNAPVFIFASTNKVYGGMEGVGVIERDGRYDYADGRSGIDEETPLDFHSPYGCSKGCADQYVRDYARIYGLKTVVFRQSCIYGYRQFGIEDQGWVAWFTIAAVMGKPLTIYGDGKQVRDILFIDDLVDAYLLATQSIERCAGQVYNIGGGRKNSVSLLQVIALLEELTSCKLTLKFDAWRPGDQKVFICDTRKAEYDFGWRPKVGWREGVKKLYEWVQQNKGLFEG